MLVHPADMAMHFGDVSSCGAKTRADRPDRLVGDHLCPGGEFSGIDPLSLRADDAVGVACLRSALVSPTQMIAASPARSAALPCADDLIGFAWPTRRSEWPRITYRRPYPQHFGGNIAGVSPEDGGGNPDHRD